MPNQGEVRAWGDLRAAYVATRPWPVTPNKDLLGWTFTCNYCDVRTIDGNYSQMNVPIRCEVCSKAKYTWQTRKDLQTTLPRMTRGFRPSLHTYTLGKTQKLPSDHTHDTFYFQLHKEMKLAFRTFIRSKWWRNRVDGCFYTIEVKVTETPEGTTYHPHVHAIVLHAGKEEFKDAASERGLGSYVYVRRITGTLQGPINYVLKYALKDYGDPSLKGRYYERTGAFRKSPDSGK